MGGGPAKDHLLCLLPLPEPKDVVDRLRKKFPDIDITYIDITSSSSSHTSNPTALNIPDDLWKDVTVLCTLRSVPNPSQAPRLDLIQLFSAGSNQLQNTPIYKDSPVTIATSSGIHGPQIAEWCAMTALVHSHHYKTLYELQKRRQWGGRLGPDAALHRVRDRVGLTLGVLGYGSIGRQVGNLARAMGMRVLAYTATPKETAEQRRDGGFIVPGTGDPEGSIPEAWYSGLDRESLRHFLAQGLDWLVVSVPLTEQTKGFLGKEEFEVLRDGLKKKQKGSSDGNDEEVEEEGDERKTFITNIARGPIIDQPALIEALKDGTLEGAALDVTDPEPLPEDSELWGLPNVIVTPHVSGNGVSYADRAFQLLAINLERRRDGKLLLNVVKRGRGY